jgi:hypothetical protein
MPTDEVPDVYVDLAKRFLNGELTADDFSLAVVRTYKREKSFFDEAEAQAMNKLFYAAEGFCGDVELRDEGDLDERQLLDAAGDFLAFVKWRRPDA